MNTDYKQEIFQQFMELLEPQVSERKCLEAYISNNSIEEMFRDAPVLGLSVDTEQKIEAIGRLLVYCGRDVTWKQSVTIEKS